MMWRGSSLEGDMLNKRVQPDRSKINIADGATLPYWMKHLGVGLDELKAAVEKVGNSVAAVRKELGMRLDN
jgi:hypothetical protein